MLVKKTVLVEAPAKLNLSLDITATRPDGYHELDTLMQAVGLCDTVAISRMPGEGVFISCDRPRIPCDATNYAHIAARRFFEAFHMDAAISIDIQKRIPSEAGLGGGSADAAAVLLGLNALLEVNAPLEALCAVGVKVGADVPFCLMGGTRRARGVGERFTSAPPLPDCHLVIAKPAQGISTPEAYQRYDRCGVQKRPDTAYLLRQLRVGNLRDFAFSMYNVLEEVADLPEVPAIRSKMIECGALGALMTGSGSAVFGIFEDRRLAKRCMRKLYDLAQGVYMTRPASHGAYISDLREA